MFTITPNKKAFLFYRILINSFYALLFVILSYFILSLFLSAFTEIDGVIKNYNWIVIPVLFLIFIFVSGLMYILRSIEYKKRSYIFEDGKIIQKSGGLFYDNQNEIIVKNITHVKLMLPFLENKLFETGNIKIEVAGSKKSEIFLQSIENPQEFYKQIRQILQKNGFALKKEKLLIEEFPHKLGVFFETLKAIIGTFFFAMYILFSSEDGGSSLYSVIQGYISLSMIISIIAPVLLVWSIFVYLDLKRRKYDIYNDTLEYTEGFLSKNYAFIPVENLSDSQIRQTMVDKIFKLYDVRISVQGSGHEVLFKNLVRGREISEILDGLIENHSKSKKIEKTKKSGSSKKIVNTKSLPITAFISELRMNMKRSLFVPVLLWVLLIFVALVVSVSFSVFGELPIVITSLVSIIPFVLIGIVVFVKEIVKVKSTRYFVQDNGMQMIYKFLSTNEVKFSNEKITGVIIKRSFIDKWFSTVSISFLSIGSSSNLRFVNIKDENNIVSNVLAKFGMDDGNEVFKTGSKFSILESIKAWPQIFVIVFLFVSIPIFSIIVILLFSDILVSNGLVSLAFLVVAVSILLIVVAVYIYQREYFKRSNIIIYYNYLYREKGIFFKTFYYSSHNKIKDITITRYAFSHLGSLQFNIAGESVTQHHNSNTFLVMGNKRGRTTITSHKIKIDLIENIDLMDDLIDILLNNRKLNNSKELSRENIPHPKTILETRQSLGNTMFIILPIIVVINFFPLLMALIWWPLLIITLAIDILIITFIIVSVKVRKYIIEDYRVLRKSGIFYKEQKSIVFNKIDFISHDQNFLNKIFHNGNITINTVGSSHAELTLVNMKNYSEFYKIIEEKYKSI